MQIKAPMYVIDLRICSSPYKDITHSAVYQLPVRKGKEKKKNPMTGAVG